MEKYINQVGINEVSYENGRWFQDCKAFNTETKTWEIVRYIHDGSKWVIEDEQSKGSEHHNKLHKTTQIDLINTKSSISLKKHVVNLDKCLVDLSKTSGISFDGVKARVALALDFSGSMEYLYSNGSMQNTLTRLVPLGLRFDDNGKIDTWLFNCGHKYIKDVSINNYENYIDNIIKRYGLPGGGTHYAPVLKSVKNKLLGWFSRFGNGDPVYLIFITDGECSDTEETTEIVKKISNNNIFIQFIGLGDDNFRYLRGLCSDKLKSIGFECVSSFEDISDEKLYNKLLSRFTEWIAIRGRSPGG